jgi:FdhE protein
MFQRAALRPNHAGHGTFESLVPMFSHDARIARAVQLAAGHLAAAPLLNFYAELARFQKPIFIELQSKSQTDLRALLCYFPPLLKLISRQGTELLANFAAENLQSADAHLAILRAMWEGGQVLDPAARFYARVLLQPYAEYLASRAGIHPTSAGPTCPFCNARPVAGVLRAEGHGAQRWLVCSLCSTEWQYPRVVCPGCGQENKDKLPIYTGAEFPAARVDACDTCQTYLKSIDLTKDGHAIPIVDEIATVALNVWAEDHDYSKLEANLLGM